MCMENKPTSRYQGKTGKSTRSVQRIIDRHLPEYEANSPQKVFLVIDAVYFKKKNGILVFPCSKYTEECLVDRDRKGKGL
jgi:hypothetical protein